LDTPSPLNLCGEEAWHVLSERGFFSLRIMLEDEAVSLGVP
jgi:hypothetical protein